MRNTFPFAKSKVSQDNYQGNQQSSVFLILYRDGIILEIISKKVLGEALDSNFLTIPIIITIIIIQIIIIIIKDLVILDKETIIWVEWEDLINLNLQFHLIKIVVLKLLLQDKNM